MPSQILVRNRVTQELESFIVPSGETVPDFLHCFMRSNGSYSNSGETLAYVEVKTEHCKSTKPFGVSNQWDFLSINSVDEAIPQKQVEIQKINSHHASTEHSAIRILLSPSTAVTCSLTGITYSVNLPSEYRTNLSLVHPLSTSENCIILLRQCAAHGVLPHLRYSKQELAGMIITLLKAKNLLRVADAVKANLFLQQAEGICLSSILEFIRTRLSGDTRSLPGLALNEQIALIPLPIKIRKNLVDMFLIGWQKACREAIDAFSRSTVGRKEKAAKTIKVYDSLTEETKKTKQAKIEALRAWNLLCKEFPQKRTVLLKIKFTIGAMEFLTKDVRNREAAEIRKQFPQSCAEATKIASIIAGSEFTEIEKSISDDDFGISEWREARKEKGKKERINLMKYLKKD